jgi:predicted TPR repeat methyltransferase
LICDLTIIKFRKTNNKKINIEMSNSTGDAQDKAAKIFAKNAAAQCRDKEKVIETYNNWSGEYEEDLNKSLYRGPAICANVCSMLLTNDQTRILDVGAGTGYANYSFSLFYENIRIKVKYI